MGIIVSLNTAPSSTTYVISGGPAGSLRLHTDDGTTQAVELMVVGPLAGAVHLTEVSFQVSPVEKIVGLTATVASTGMADGTIEVLSSGVVVATYNFTAITEPEIQFEGRFQCRLATDPDGFDNPWGAASSFGMYAVQGPDAAAP